MRSNAAAIAASSVMSRGMGERPDALSLELSLDLSHAVGVGVDESDRPAVRRERGGQLDDRYRPG